MLSLQIFLRINYTSIVIKQDGLTTKYCNKQILAVILRARGSKERNERWSKFLVGTGKWNSWNMEITRCFEQSRVIALRNYLVSYARQNTVALRVTKRLSVRLIWSFAEMLPVKYAVLPSFCIQFILRRSRHNFLGIPDHFVALNSVSSVSRKREI